MTVDASRLAVVVVNYGSSDLLARNLVAVARALPRAQVVVVDNFSSAAERDAVRRIAGEHGWHAELSERNDGFGAGMNRGVARARREGAEFFLLLNPDAVIAAPDAEAMLAQVAAEPMTLVAPRILRPDGTVWSAGDDLYLEDGRIRSRRRRLPSSPRPIVPWLTGACLLVSARLWDAVGGFDTRYFLYWEDVDLSWRVVAAGGRLAVSDTATAVHDEGGTQDSAPAVAPGAKSATYYYYNVRNRLVFAAAHLDDDDVRRWLAHSPRVSREILMNGGRRQFLVHPVRPVLAMLRGLRDGRRIARGRLAAAPDAWRGRAHG